jgi:hypothetical protein
LTWPRTPIAKPGLPDEDVLGDGQQTVSVHRGPAVRVQLLGGFRIERAGEVILEEAWRRRAAASLVKLLVLAPGVGCIESR